MDIIESLKMITGETDEKLLSLLFLRSKSIVLSETNRTVLTEQLEAIQLEVALELYNRQGSEAESSRSEGGVSVSYKDGLSNTIISQLNQFRLARVSGRAFEKK